MQHIEIIVFFRSHTVEVGGSNPLSPTTANNVATDRFIFVVKAVAKEILPTGHSNPFSNW